MKEYLLKNVRLIDPARKIDQVCDLGVAGNQTDILQQILFHKL